MNNILKDNNILYVDTKNSLNVIMDLLPEYRVNTVTDWKQLKQLNEVIRKAHRLIYKNRFIKYPEQFNKYGYKV